MSNPLIVFVAQAFLIIAGSRILGRVTRWMGQPMVVAEVVAGILLGPSLLGAAAPSVEAALFPPAPASSAAARSPRSSPGCRGGRRA
ncbi:MAG TPA: hypothetical protein VHW23_13730 [Kofleriaceae bacterium]|nr:hypothetical protein [Kofleriaceae bacterium]